MQPLPRTLIRSQFDDSSDAFSMIIDVRRGGSMHLQGVKAEYGGRRGVNAKARGYGDTQMAPMITCFEGSSCNIYNSVLEPHNNMLTSACDQKPCHFENNIVYKAGDGFRVTGKASLLRNMVLN